MEVFEINAEEYQKLIHAKEIYNKAEFNMLNAVKVDMVHYLIFKDSKYRFGLIIGESGDEWLCPFSAPFGTFVNVKSKWDIFQLNESIQSFDKFMKGKRKKVVFVLPPEFYNPLIVCNMENALFNCGYLVEFIDVNFQMNLHKLYSENYKESLPYNGRKNLRIAQESGLVLHKCETIEEKKSAYDVIQINRNSRGYPLNMTWEQVLNTIKLVRNDMFLVFRGDEEIAAALVYHVTDRIGSVIYWGDKPGFTDLKPINYLSYQLIQYYGEMGQFDYLDIGISSDHGVINYGLSDFKLSIGCDISSKITMYKDYASNIPVEGKGIMNSCVADGTLRHNDSYISRR